jgi:uncharacterized protein (TIGR02588 family)
MAASRHTRAAGIPPLEWAAATVGLVLVCGALGVMVWLGLARGDTPADVSVRVDAVTALAKGYVVTIRAVNRGGITAADVTVEGELRSATGVAETSTMSFKYLAPHSERRGGLYFEKDPRQFELKLKPKGYETP